MNAPDILAHLRHMGMSLALDKENIRVSPKAAITDNARALIRAHRNELVVALREAANDTPRTIPPFPPIWRHRRRRGPVPPALMSAAPVAVVNLWRRAYPTFLA